METKCTSLKELSEYIVETGAHFVMEVEGPRIKAISGRIPDNHKEITLGEDENDWGRQVFLIEYVPEEKFFYVYDDCDGARINKHRNLNRLLKVLLKESIAGDN